MFAVLTASHAWINMYLRRFMGLGSMKLRSTLSGDQSPVVLCLLARTHPVCHTGRGTVSAAVHVRRTSATYYSRACTHLPTYNTNQLYITPAIQSLTGKRSVEKQTKQIGHSGRPRRASATALLRTGTDVCKTGAGAGSVGNGLQAEQPQVEGGPSRKAKARQC